MKTLGICFGATSMQCVELESESDNCNVVSTRRLIHDGNIRNTFINFMNSIKNDNFDKIAVTGREFRNNVNLTSISEPEAIEFSLRNKFSKESGFPDLVVSLGGETQLVYEVDSDGGIAGVYSGSKCASGTGEFFIQQIGRMGLNLETAIDAAQKGIPHKVAGRCSVFCKSDCTHALNKGEPVENVVAGLCEMMADKIEELIKERKRNWILVIGGGSLNSALVDILKNRFKKVSVLDKSAVFEAYGAALWAIKNDCLKTPNISDIIIGEPTSFELLPPLNKSENLVSFKNLDFVKAVSDEECILGLDVGSTTTKAVLLRKADNQMLASVYLRTNGDPITASKNCYKKILEELNGVSVNIIALGVTGSGRQIAGLHALTKNVINEIIAHASAASFFDNDVDTIFEIGGQDAKYTYLTHGIPSDYAMNEACSAGTGSFLEESSKESLNVAMEDIGNLAMQSNTTPNFSDQCSAFISSDIKKAGQQGIPRNDILAGLVNSVCMNYLNRVKGARPVGKKIFMQGGVCYNKAIPIAMASLVGAKIIVPPHPGLMGAFGVAVAVNKKLDDGEIEPNNFDLKELSNRTAKREGSFICNGGKEHCDRKCEISRIRINGQIYAFGGSCDKYYNVRLNKKTNTASLDYVKLRQELMFKDFGPVKSDIDKINATDKVKTIGLTPAFLMQSLYPLFSNFFTHLGLKIIISDSVDPMGISRVESSFCYPTEMSHGWFLNLIKKNCDYIFLPQIMQVPVKNVPTYSRACAFVQGEPYYLKTTFRKEIENSGSNILSPVLKMQFSYESALSAIVKMGKEIGYNEKEITDAWNFACSRQNKFEDELLNLGKQALDYLKEDPKRIGIVLFGRPYNAYVDEANMGIPHKISSRNYLVIPYEMLPADSYTVDKKMFWAMGQRIMKSAHYVRDHENLYGVYITNFSCGPDSFLLSYYRELMGRKPSLTLELDQHTADAGIDTRIEAALDIMSAHRKSKLIKQTKLITETSTRVIVENGKNIVLTEDGEKLELTDSRVEVLIPSMGELATQGTAAILRGAGINARALPIADRSVHQLGKKNTLNKECLPYIVNTGAFLNYLNNKKDPNKISLFVMATGGGPCRLGQYFRSFERILIKQGFKNCAMLTITDENGYAGLGAGILLRAWQSIVITDILSDIRSMLKVTAKDATTASAVVEKQWKQCLAYFEGTSKIKFFKLLKNISKELSNIPLKKKPKDIPVISLVGEIFVRRDEFSRGSIVDYLEDNGFMVRISPLGEYPLYGNYVINSGLGERTFTFGEKIKMRLTANIQEWFEKRIKKIMSESGLYKYERIDIPETIDGIKHIMNNNFRGECILTVGSALKEILNHSCGIISIGPFGCMYSRIAESMLKKEMNADGKARMPKWKDKHSELSQIGALPFLHIETDGTPYPQLVEANLEAFLLRAWNVHDKMKTLGLL